jgi:glucose/arabinose dehydrogenase
MPMHRDAGLAELPAAGASALRHGRPRPLTDVKLKSILAAAAMGVLGAAGWYCSRGPSGCDGRIEVPETLCATIYADDVGPARHLAVAANGTVYAATWREGERTGGIVALRDTNDDGVADQRARFGPEGGSGIAIADGRLYFATMNNVFRYALDPNALVPRAPPETVVTAMPWLEHGARSIAVHRGRLYLNIGVPSNACERDYPRRIFEGVFPCRELENSGGIWAFDALATSQRPTLANRYATGLRHTVALLVNPRDGKLYGAPHGIDHLDRWWPSAGYTDRDAATIPSETLFRIDSAGDYGFPYCMHDPRSGRMIVTPAYVAAPVGHRCERAPRPIATFAAHAAPMAMAFATSDALGAEYRGGLFVALHGSLFHGPESPRGYAVIFVDPANGQTRPFASSRRLLGNSSARPSGLAVRRDGSLLVADDHGRRVWLIRRR